MLCLVLNPFSTENYLIDLIDNLMPFAGIIWDYPSRGVFTCDLGITNLCLCWYLVSKCFLTFDHSNKYDESEAMDHQGYAEHGSYFVLSHFLLRSDTMEGKKPSKLYLPKDCLCSTGEALWGRAENEPRCSC